MKRWSYGEGFAVGMLSGLVLAIAYTLAATVVLLLRRASSPSPPDVELLTLVVLYLGGFTAGGLIVGALNPLARTASGSVLLGILAFIPVAQGAMGIVTGSYLPSTIGDLFAPMMTAGLLGGGLGYAFWREFVRSR